MASTTFISLTMAACGKMAILTVVSVVFSDLSQ